MLIVPEVKGVFLKFSIVGFKVQVNALEPTEAVMGWMGSAPPVGAVDCHVVPLDVNTLPDVLGATACNADVPLPSNTLLAVNVGRPVPPLPTATVPVTLAEL